MKEDGGEGKIMIMSDDDQAEGVLHALSESFSGVAQIVFFLIGQAGPTSLATISLSTSSCTFLFCNPLSTLSLMTYMSPPSPPPSSPHPH
eukprot:755699-Hanusia_phi.AAC.6